MDECKNRDTRPLEWKDGESERDVIKLALDLSKYAAAPFVMQESWEAVPRATPEWWDGLREKIAEIQPILEAALSAAPTPPALVPKSIPLETLIEELEADSEMKASMNEARETVMLDGCTVTDLPAPPEVHSDDLAVDRFATAMKEKLATARAKGRSGWDDSEQCSVEHLRSLLHSHLSKGDPVDVGNFAMMLYNRDGRTTPPEVEPVAWVEVKDTYEGPYEFHGIRLLRAGKHNLYTSPPSPADDEPADDMPGKEVEGNEPLATVVEENNELVIDITNLMKLSSGDRIYARSQGDDELRKAAEEVVSKFYGWGIVDNGKSYFAHECVAQHPEDLRQTIEYLNEPEGDEDHRAPWRVVQLFYREER